MSVTPVGAPRLLYAIRLYMRLRQITPSYFGRALGDPGFVYRLMRGAKPQPRTAAKALAYMDAQLKADPQ